MNNEHALEPTPKNLFQPGDVVGGRFEVLREIGHGGMGVVYEAKNCLTGVRVAIKTILPRHINNTRAAERFVREITTLRGLNHPNIVAVFDVGREKGALFFVMEYLNGTTLRQLMQRKRQLSLEQTTWILRGVANALGCAHERGVVHRDLSPENVMILRDGAVKLLDFGLAHAENRSVLTAPGTMMGKAFYVAPEQRRDAASVDARTDIYAMGVMFYEMLSGQLPTGYQRLTELVPELPRACDTLVEKTVAPLERRTASVADFRKLLDASVEAKSPGVLQQRVSAALAGPRRKGIAYAAAILLVLTAASGALLWLNGPGESLPAIPAAANEPAGQGRPLDALSYVWDAANPDGLITRLRFAPSPIMGQFFELEGSELRANGSYELESAENAEHARVLHLKVDSVSMRGGAMLSLTKPVLVDALARIESDTLTLAMDRTWIATLKPIAETLYSIPHVDSEQEIMERLEVVVSAQNATQKAGPFLLPKSLRETNEVAVVVLQRSARYADDPHAARMSVQSLSQLDQETYAPLAGPLELRWTENGDSAVLRIGNTSVEFVLIYPGTFTMGSESGFVEEGNAPHRVTISKPFWMGKYELTQAQWQAVMGSVPSPIKGSDLAVDALSWEDADLFVRRLNRHRIGVRFSLPTEAQWEYAARAGTKTDYFFGTDKFDLRHYAWCSEQKMDSVQPVGQLKPNPWGLYDMYGNVSEWCADWFGQEYYRVSPPADPQGPDQGVERILRGSTYLDDPAISTSYKRNWFPPKLRRDAVGLRLCAEKR